MARNSVPDTGGDARVVQTTSSEGRDGHALQQCKARLQRERRLAKNRATAAKSRERRREAMRQMQVEAAILSEENTLLKQQLGEQDQRVKELEKEISDGRSMLQQKHYGEEASCSTWLGDLDSICSVTHQGQFSSTSESMPFFLGSEDGLLSSLLLHSTAAASEAFSTL